MAATTFSTTLRNGRADAIKTAIDAGGAAAKLRIYDGTRPAGGGAATTLLAELTFSYPSAAAASGGVLTFSAITSDSSADATGTATWARIVTSAGTYVMDCDVTVTAGAGPVELSSTSITAGNTVAVSSFTITDGNP